MEGRMKSDMDTCRTYEPKKPENSLFYYKTNVNLLDKVQVQERHKHSRSLNVYSKDRQRKLE